MIEDVVPKVAFDGMNDLCRRLIKENRRLKERIKKVESRKPFDGDNYPQWPVHDEPMEEHFQCS